MGINQLANFLLLVLCLLNLSCSVKARPIGNEQLGVVTGTFPEAIFWTQQRKFLVLASKNQFSVGDVTVSYKAYTEDLQLVSDPAFSFSIGYRMPEMPDMPVKPADKEQSSNGETKVIYEISMGGLWEITLTINKDGVPVDSVTYSFMVPE